MKDGSSAEDYCVRGDEINNNSKSMIKLLHFQAELLTLIHICPKKTSLYFCRKHHVIRSYSMKLFWFVESLILPSAP